MDTVESHITPRTFRVAFPEDIPRHWANGSAFLTAVLNTYTLLVPDNELYYMRTLRKTLGRIDDTGLKDDLLAFFRQEGEHGMAHRRYRDNLRAQGYRFDSFVNIVGFLLYRIIEPILPLKLHVAIVAAIEHFNALLGHLFLKNDILRDSDPRMKLLFEFHFSEEIEHKAVSVDALRAIGGGEFIRISGMVIAAPLLYLTFTVGTVMFLVQDRQLLRGRTIRDMWQHFFTRDGMVWGSLVLLGRYCLPGFHPSDIDDAELARNVFRGEFANRDSYPQVESSAGIEP